VYTSSHAHSSIDKAALALGLGLDNVVHIDVDDQFRMRPEALAGAIADDNSRGYLPLACVATVGTTSTTSIDPVPAIAEICRREGTWLHVDGAYGGIAAIVPEMRDVFAGVDHADSLVVNPHKWLFTPFDCSAFFTTKPDVLERAFSLVHEYLVTPERESVVDFMNYGVQLGRRFRALKLWMVIRGFGTIGLAARIRAHCALARTFADWVRADSAWEVVAPVPFSLVCFRYAPSGVHEEVLNAMNATILSHVNASGEVFLSHTKLDGRYVLRLAVGNIRTEERHVRRAWELLQESAAATR
jgi:aromatic-L-amino-acid decarboxylase